MSIQEDLLHYAEGIEDSSGTPWHENPWARMLYDAAARIDQLETVLREIADIKGLWDEPAMNGARAAAREALGESA